MFQSTVRDAPPAVPDAYKLYNSYATDPAFQLYFTYSWLGLLALSVLVLNPVARIVDSIRSRRIFQGWLITESLTTRYSQLDPAPTPSPSASVNTEPIRSSPALTLARSQRLKLTAGACWSSFLGHPISSRNLPRWNVGQILLAGFYTAVVCICVCKDAELQSNPNRLGFIALAQLTPLFLLATKNNPLTFLLGVSSEKFNFAHRWAGRLVWLCATCHGAIWMNSFRHAGDIDRTLSNAKSQRGVVAYSFLCLIAISSIKPIRVRVYPVFWTLHFISFIGFFAAIAYHTPYAQPWLFPPVALYAFDLFARLFKCRFKDAVLVPLHGMTLIHIPDANQGFLPTQHVWLRVFSSSFSAFESHPFTIISSSSSSRPGVTLLASVSGDWTRNLHTLASSGEMGEKGDGPVMTRVVVDGPYGGRGWRGLDQVEEVLCIAGGSGVSFLLGVAEEARALRHTQGEETNLRIVRLVWILRDYEAFITLLPLISTLLSSFTTLSVYITKSNAAPAPSPFPHITIFCSRPSLPALILSTLEEDGATRGVEVMACGPSPLVVEVKVTVGSIGVRERVAMGGVSVWGEGFSI